MLFLRQHAGQRLEFLVEGWQVNTAMKDYEKKNWWKTAIGNIDRSKARDTGMAMVLLCLIAWIFTKTSSWVLAAMVLLIINMTVPMIFRPLGVLWFGISRLLGNVVSRILLSLVFYLLVTPVGLARRAMGYDTLKLKQWKQSRQSVFVKRNHCYKAADVEQPF